MKVVLVHDWLIHMRGGERVLEALAEVYPEAPIYTLFYSRRRLSPGLRSREIIPSFLHYLPGIRLYYRWLLPVLPLVIRTLKIRHEADLVFSTSHCVAKAIGVPSGARHVCYCHTPMRYLWAKQDDYFGKWPGLIKPLLRLVLNRLQKWDQESNRTVDAFISNSENVRLRIRDFYGRESSVIHPPVNLETYYPSGETGDYYLAVSAFVPYKRVDLVIEAFNALDRKLMIVGSGPLESAYRSLRKSRKISFLGSLPDAELHRLMAGARAVLFPTDEDFGIVPLEAQACGVPVIAYGGGGALESVQSGVFFDKQSADSLQAAVMRFEKMTFDAESVAAKVRSFDKSCFKTKIEHFVSDSFQETQSHVDQQV